MRNRSPDRHKPEKVLMLRFSTENAYVESFHDRLRDECLNMNWFWNLFAARRKIAACQRDYNTQRPG